MFYIFSIIFLNIQQHDKPHCLHNTDAQLQESNDVNYRL